MPPRRKWASRLRSACWLYVGLLVAWAALLRLGDCWAPATLLLFGPRWPAAVPLLVLAPAAARYRRRSLAALGLAAVLALGPVMGLRVPWRSALTPRGGVGVRVMTWNVHYRRPDGAALLQWLDEARPDVAVFQEWRTPAGTDPLDGPGWHRHRAGDMVLASRFPVRAAEALGTDSMEEGGAVVRYELDTPAGPLELFSVHLATVRRGLEGEAGEPWHVFDGLAANGALRRRQAERLAEAAGRAGRPVLLAGDFNAPPEGCTYRDSLGRYTDAFATAGWGFGYTFRNRGMQLRIDHVLAGAGWSFARCSVGPDLGSPHRPVVADAVWVGFAD